MSSAVACCAKGAGLREASRMFNVPLATLYRRVNGIVELSCKPGPQPFLPADTEERLMSYIVNMQTWDLGYHDKMSCV